MDFYIGTKQIKARPMTRGEFVEYTNGYGYRENEKPEGEGYLVEYLDSPNSNHPDHECYISWSPREVFEAAYIHIKPLEKHSASVTSILKYFQFEHLPTKLQRVSAPYCRLAYEIASISNNQSELVFALRKLLESKDCAVRSALSN